MCIIIDTNVLGSVFKKDSDKHQEFKPVLDWIVSGKGKAVYGGAKYIREIGKQYLGILSQLRTANKAIYVANELVDSETIVVHNTVQDNDFDDQHLVALLRISKCKLICSDDARAYKYFKDLRFFGVARCRPKIYSSGSNANLLNDGNIAEICKPCGQSTTIQINLLKKIFNS